jgi:hypothetical protein
MRTLASKHTNMEWIKAVTSPARAAPLLLYELLCEPRNSLFILLLFVASRILTCPCQPGVEAANCTVSATSEFRSTVYGGLEIIFVMYNLFWDIVCYCIIFILSLPLVPLEWLLAF